MSNLVSNVGVVATDTTGVGTARYGSAATSTTARESFKHKEYGPN